MTHPVSAKCKETTFPTGNFRLTADALSRNQPPLQTTSERALSSTVRATGTIARSARVRTTSTVASAVRPGANAARRLTRHSGGREPCAIADSTTHALQATASALPRTTVRQTLVRLRVVERRFSACLRDSWRVAIASRNAADGPRYLELHPRRGCSNVSECAADREITANSAARGEWGVFRQRGIVHGPENGTTRRHRECRGHGRVLPARVKAPV